MTRAILFACLGLLAFVALAANAEAAQTTVRGCTSVTIRSGASVLAYGVGVWSEIPSALSHCGDAWGGQVVTHKAPAGSCLDLRVVVRAFFGGGPPPPVSPTGINVYVFLDTTQTDHGATGALNWANPIRRYELGSADPQGRVLNFCMTTDGTTTGAARAGTVRAVLRVCSYVGATGDGCQGTAVSYDYNTDYGSNGGLAPGGYQVVEQSEGALVGGEPYSCWTDSTTLGGNNVDVYVPGDTPTVRLCGARSFATTGTDSANFALLAQGGGTITSATFPSAATNAQWDITLSPSIRAGDAYPNSTSPTMRLTISGTSALLGEAWTYIASVPAGAIITTPTQADAPWGLVDKSLNLACTRIQDPVLGTAETNIQLLNRGEAFECRASTAKNARGENYPIGTPYRHYLRRLTQPTQDTTDNPVCQGTLTNTALEAFECDTLVGTSATVTTGKAYLVELVLYVDAGRTTELVRATTPGLLDVSATYTFADAAGACAARVGVTHVLVHKGEQQTVTFRLCNARQQEVKNNLGQRPDVVATVTTDEAGTLEVTSPTMPGTITPYSWTFTAPISASVQHTTLGQSKTLGLTNLGNTAQFAKAYNQTDLLTLGIHTWLNNCEGPEWNTFVVAADLICQQEGPIQNARGATWTQSLTVLRWYNETGGSLVTLPSDTAAGVTTGTTSPHRVVPQPPASAQWRFEAHVFDASGNYGDAARSLTFISPYTSIHQLACLGNAVPTAPGEAFNVTVQVLRRDPTTLILEPYEPDAPPSYRVNATTSTGAWENVVPTTLAPRAPGPALHWANWTVPASWSIEKPALLVVSANVTGASISTTCPLQIQEQGGSDPLHASAAYSWDTHRATLAIVASFTNGTARTGMASELNVRLQQPDGTDSSLSIPVTEGGAPGTYYAQPYLGIAPQRGVWIVTIDAPQPTGSGRASTTTAFLIEENATLLFLDQRDLLVDYWSATNASFQFTWDLVNQSRAENNASFAYTWDLINATLANANATAAEPGDLTTNFTGDGPFLIYAGRSARVEGNSTNGTRAPWYWTWDWGDKTTGEGIVAYHAWEKPGSYTVTARATNALAQWSTTNFSVEVRLSTPVLNVTGPRTLKLGEVGTWTTGTSHDPYDDVAFSFVSDPRKVNVWLLGERWTNAGYCGSLNATSLRAPDEAGIQLPFLQAQWALHRAETCTTFRTAWSQPGEHHVVLYGLNKHGVLVSLDYVVHVGDARERIVPAPHRPGAPVVEPIDFRPIVDETRESINGFLDFIKWLTGG